MTRPGKLGGIRRRSATRPVLEALEGRSLPSGITFASAFDVGVTGNYAAIRSNAVTTDAAGDTYITGSFRGTAGFDPYSTGSSFTTNGTEDTFVAKYSPTGLLDWAVTFAGQATTHSGGTTTYATGQGSAIAVDGSGNVFVAGSFSGTIGLGESTGVTQVSSVASADEPFVAKLGPSGVVTWFAAVPGTAYDTDTANALALDGSGGVMIVGTFSDSATFGPTTLSAGGSSDAFAARVNGSGAFLWAVATQGSSGSNASATGVAADGSGNLDVVGYFSGSVDFEPSASKDTLTSAGSDDVSVWKLGPTGNFLWARSYGSTDYDGANALAVDGSGDLYVTGAFSDSVNFGTTSRIDSITAGPIYDAFLLKVDPNGNELWVKGLVGPTGSSNGLGIAVDKGGYVHLAGTFSGPVDFDPGPGVDTLTSVASSDVFAAGYDSNGNLFYALQAGVTNFNAALAAAVDPTGDVAITGVYSGSIALGSATLPTFPKGSIFVARIPTVFPPAAPSAPVLEASSDSGLSQSDGITVDTSPVLDVNTAVATDTVELLRNGVVVAQRAGPGALADPGPLADGTYTYTAVQVSPFGLVSPASGSCSVTILTVPPAAPPAPTLSAADDSGTVGDAITNVTRPRLAVVASQGPVTIQLLNAAGSVIGSASEATAGTWPVAPTSNLTDGVHAIRARLVDVAGNVGLASPAFNLTIDTTPPAAPSAPTLLAADDSGTVGDGVTNVRQPRLTATAEAGSTVQLVDGSGNAYGSAVASSGGAFTVKVSLPLPDGTYRLSARATDAAGNQGPAGQSFSLTILATPPPAPSTLSIVAADVSGPAGSNLTNVRQPRITGTAKAGSTVEILNTSGTPLAVTTAGAGGGYTVAIAGPFADGTYTIDAVAIDGAGNSSPLSPTLTLTIDTTPPAAPSAPALLAADDSGAVGDRITDVRQPRLTGMAEAGSTVTLLNGSTVIGTTVATSGGAYTVKPSSPLADGAYTLSARATDAAGNQGTASSPVGLTILDTPPPAPSAPTLLAADDSGAVGDRITDVRQPRLTGTSIANLTVRLVNASGTVIGTATASSTGAATVTPSTALADGTYVLDLVAVDAAGNLSLPGGTISLTILGTPPPRPPAPTLLASDDTGVAGDGMTSVKRPRIVGTAALGDRVDWLSSTGTVLASTTASASNGSYQFQLPNALPNGTVPVTVRATDVAGNVGPTSPVFNLTIRADVGDDFGTGQSDIAAFRTGDATFFVQKPPTGATYVQQFGGPGDVPINGDFFGNGHGDVAIYRPSTSTFYAYDPVTGAFKYATVGQPGDVPVPADYDGDGQTDFAAYVPSTATYLIQTSSTGTITTRQFGGLGDVPVPADYFGNGHADFAFYRPSNSTFYVYDPISNQAKIVTVGLAGSTPVPADYEGIGRVDPAVFEPGIAAYVIQMSTGSTYTRQFGGVGDIPVPGDYVGNGRADIALYRPSVAVFFGLDIINSASKVVQWGTPYATWPTMAPITLWFSFGNSPSGRSIKPPGVSADSISVDGPIALTIEVDPGADSVPPSKTKAVGPSIVSPSLGRWRPGD